MTRRALPAAVLGLIACCGCPLPSDRDTVHPPVGPRAGSSKPLTITHVRLGVERLGSIPNSGLLLPCVSPDGRHVAYLQAKPDAEANRRSLLTGEGLEDVSLLLRPTTADADARVVCPSGAAWPAWSPDGGKLAFVIAGPKATCRLGLHDLATAQTRRLSVGTRWMMMLALSADARQVAAAVPGDTPDTARLHVIDLAAAALTPLPLAAETRWQLWPTWCGRALALLRRTGERTELARWAPGRSPAWSLTLSAGPATVGEALQVFAGIGTRLSPDGRKLAYYDAAADQVTVADLAGGAVRTLADGTRAGCWLGNRHLLAATNSQLSMTAADTGESKLLLRGRWLPLWADAPSRQALVCTATAEDPWTFQLVRLRFLSD